MFSEPTFWWGASLALLPTFGGAVGVSYSGMAAFNAIWRQTVDREAPWPLIVLAGVFYGLVVGVLLPCLLLGAAAYLIWPLTSRRLAPILHSVSSPWKVAMWVGLELVTAPLSIALSLGAYGLPWLFLGAA